MLSVEQKTTLWWKWNGIEHGKIFCIVTESQKSRRLDLVLQLKYVWVIVKIKRPLSKAFFIIVKASLLCIINSPNKVLLCYILRITVCSTSEIWLLICNKNVFLYSIELYLYSMKNISHLRKYIYTQLSILAFNKKYLCSIKYISIQFKMFIFIEKYFYSNTRNHYIK